MIGRRGLAALAVAGALCLGVGIFVVRAANPNALWEIVHDRCVPAAAAGTKSPCAELDPDHAILKDIVGATQYLLIPTARITGIESPVLLDPATPNYFAEAWLARHYIDSRVGHAMPRDMISLEINPPTARTQEQLHIHMDCVRPDVRQALLGAEIGEGWTRLPKPLMGQYYTAMRLRGENLDRNPFQILADTVPGAREAMGRYTLILTGSIDPKTGPGFILLAGQVGPDGPGQGEELQDHDCALAKE